MALYAEDVRRQVMDQLSDLKKDQPLKYQMVVDEIIDIVRGAHLYEPVGPDDE